ncbi:MAG: NgoBV family restriction endonuclease [Oscillospiraceae bacterium]|nr:NgoBV family restriction endonuclease [Oscillospiraceae bacterium]
MNSLEELYDKAVRDIKNELGVITITIAGIPKISKSNDIIGNCVQEWIPQWLSDNGLELEANESSQVFPDFTANINGVKHDMEIKCWNYTNNPAFDLANFDGFYREVYTHPNKLHAKYLVFGYTPTMHGFRINNVYLKNLWELTSRAQKYPIGLQVKQEQPYAIRPYAFHKRPTECFANIQEFVRAIYETRKMFALENRIDPDMWYETVIRGLNEMDS